MGLLVALMRRVVVTVGVNEHSGVVEIARHTRRWRIVGLLLGGVAAAVALVLGQRVDALGRVTALAPTVLGAGILLGTIAGELTARPSVGIRRSAAVETRTLGAVLPRGRAVVLAVSTALLVGALAVGAAWGSADDQGRAGRVFSRICTVVDADLGPVTMGSSRGPWPGSFYVLPLAVALLVLAVLVAARPARHRQPAPPRARQPGARHPAAPLVGGQRAHRGHGHRARHARAGGRPHGLGARRRCPATGSSSTRSWPSTAALVGPVRHRGAAFGLLAGLVLTPTIRVDDLPRPLPGDVAPGRGAGAMTLSTVTVDVLDPTPPYEQLRRQLADLIGSGVLSPGDRLPPVRQLAADLGLAAGTVARTYRELEQAGYVRSRRGGGTRVATTAPSPHHAAARPRGGRHRLPRPGAGPRRRTRGCRRDGSAVGRRLSTGFGWLASGG